MVLAGYVAALLVAAVGTYVLSLINTSPDAAGGMQAFGDVLRFLGLFGFLALFPTAMALYFLRPVKKFWSLFSGASLALAATGPVFAVLIGRREGSPWAGSLVGLLGLLKVLGAPLLGLGFLVCAALAPTGRSRWVLVAAAGIEFAVGAYAYYCLWVLGHWLL